MIKKPTTSEVMAVFTNAVKDADALRTDLGAAKEQLEKKLSLMDTQYEYALDSLMNLKGSLPEGSSKIVFAAEEKYGQFDSFGMTVHPKLAKDPRNLFNYLTTRGYLYKGNVSATANGAESKMLTEALKHDSIGGKDAFIEEFQVDTMDIVITPNLKTPLGSLRCNMIEFQPFLPGSFNIEYINVYSRDDMYHPAHVISGGIANVGSQRVILSEKVDVGKVEMRVKLLYKNSNGAYPFGLRHLYFLEANFVSGSHVIVRTDRNRNIEKIYDDIAIKTQYGSSKNESSKDWGIRYYAAYDGENLTREIETSTETVPSIISSNVKAVFLYIPLTTSLISIVPHID